jgi:hypothetical protein
MALKAYPLSSPDGKPIPIDVMSPISSGTATVSSASMGAVIALGDMIAACLEIWATVDCELAFSATPVTAGNGVYRLRATDPRLIYIGDNTNLSAISTVSGRIVYNVIDIWDTLGTQYQLDTRE